jgi:hypothetical protein
MFSGTSERAGTAISLPSFLSEFQSNHGKERLEEAIE